VATRPDQELDAMHAVLSALVDLGSDEQQRVIEWVTRKLNLGSRGSASSAVEISAVYAGATSPKHGREVVSPKQFLVEKRPKTDVERVTCLAYYLSRFRDTPEFKTKDITALNREAAQPALSNAAMAVSNASTLSQYLVPSSGGRKQITPRGESVVEALPDRERVREALEGNPIVGRNRRKAWKRAKRGV
jgi:hypothetical protein